METVAPMQDSTPAEHACSAMEFLRQKRPGFISPEFWPPNSLDLKPVD